VLHPHSLEKKSSPIQQTKNNSPATGTRIKTSEIAMPQQKTKKRCYAKPQRNKDARLSVHHLVLDEGECRTPQDGDTNEQQLGPTLGHASPIIA
jgi:hypothetical protein